MVRRILGFVFVALVASFDVTSGRVMAAQNSAVRPAMDFSGTWVGTLRIPEPGERWQASKVQVLFKQSGHALSGSLAFGSTAQAPIAKGVIEATKFGTSLWFELRGADFVMRFELRPDGDALRGVARVDGSRRTAPIELHRAPAASAPKAPAPSAPAPAKEPPPAPASAPKSAPAAAPASAATSAPAPAPPFSASGTWAGNFTLTGDTLPVHAQLSQSGADLSGTIGPDVARQKAIVRGKVESTGAGTKIRFEMELEKENVVMIFELQPADGGLKGTVTAIQNNERVAGTIELKPVK
jgi:hypothetical protein